MNEAAGHVHPAKQGRDRGLLLFLAEPGQEDRSSPKTCLASATVTRTKNAQNHQ